MTDSDRPLTARQRRAVTAVLMHQRLDDAARSVGVSPRTLRRWRARDTFTDAVRTEARTLDRDSVDQIRAAQSEAVHALRTALGDETAAGVRVRAAAVLLDAGGRARVEDLEDRLMDLEQRMNGVTQ